MCVCVCVCVCVTPPLILDLLILFSLLHLNDTQNESSNKYLSVKKITPTDPQEQCAEGLLK